MSQSIKFGHIPLSGPIAGGVTVIPPTASAPYGVGQTNLETHTRRFSNGMVATLTFDMREGRLHEIRCRWSKKLTRKRVLPIYPEYLAWRDAAFAQLAEKYGLGTQMIIDLPESTKVSGGLS